jgi:hypothetical protein
MFLRNVGFSLNYMLETLEYRILHNLCCENLMSNLMLWVVCDAVWFCRGTYVSEGLATSIFRVESPCEI